MLNAFVWSEMKLAGATKAELDQYKAGIFKGLTPRPAKK
jgi:hypothetical protein